MSSHLYPLNTAIERVIGWVNSCNEQFELDQFDDIVDSLIKPRTKTKNEFEEAQKQITAACVNRFKFIQDKADAFIGSIISEPLKYNNV